MPKKETNSARLFVPVTPSQKRKFQAAARRARRTLSDWLRVVAEEAVAQERARE